VICQVPICRIKFEILLACQLKFVQLMQQKNHLCFSSYFCDENFLWSTCFVVQNVAATVLITPEGVTVLGVEENSSAFDKLLSWLSVVSLQTDVRSSFITFLTSDCITQICSAYLYLLLPYQQWLYVQVLWALWNLYIDMLCRHDFADVLSGVDSNFILQIGTWQITDRTWVKIV
jgi:hypothetical protein